MALAAYAKECPNEIGRGERWRFIAIGKAVYRLSRPGTHKVVEMKDQAGRTHRVQWNYQARATSRMLFYVGKALWKDADWLVEKHADEVIRAKNAGSQPLAG